MENAVGYRLVDSLYGRGAVEIPTSCLKTSFILRYRLGPGTSAIGLQITSTSNPGSRHGASRGCATRVFFTRNTSELGVSTRPGPRTPNHSIGKQPMYGCGGGLHSVLLRAPGPRPRAGDGPTIQSSSTNAARPETFNNAFCTRILKYYVT